MPARPALENPRFEVVLASSWVPAGAALRFARGTTHRHSTGPRDGLSSAEARPMARRRRERGGQGRSAPVGRSILTSRVGTDWRRARGRLSPAFPREKQHLSARASSSNLHPEELPVSLAADDEPRAGELRVALQRGAREYSGNGGGIRGRGLVEEDVVHAACLRREVIRRAANRVFGCRRRMLCFRIVTSASSVTSKGASCLLARSVSSSTVQIVPSASTG